MYLSPAPLYHTAPQVSVAIALRMRSTAVVMEHFDPALYLDLVGRYRVTHSQVVPDHVLPHAQAARTGAGGGRRVVAGGRHPRGGAVPGAGQGADDRVVRADPARVLRGDRGNGCTFIDSEDWLAHKGTVGRAVLSEILILDDDGDRVPGRARRGRCGSAARPTSSTSTTPSKTAASRRDDGTTSTVGDVGYLDADGYLFLTDRKAHMIISGGVNIYPQETENLLVTHPSVLDAAVIGVPNEDLGEEVKAVVQPVDGVVGRRGAGAGAHRVLPGPPGPLQVPAHGRLRGRAAPPADRQALQGGVARALLGDHDTRIV